MIFMPSCKEMAERATRGEFENASWFTKIMVKLHMGMCENCRLFGKQMSQIAEAVKEKADRSVDPERVSALKKRLISRLSP
jgi:predicted anti-sigma-YlaC factor YlaD